MQKTAPSIKSIFSSVQDNLDGLDDHLINKVSAESRILAGIMQDVFKAGGKRVRPAISFLIFKALLEDQELRAKYESNQTDYDHKIFLIAELTELIHTASLVHDDIIDHALIRRGLATVNSKWDDAVTVISGDFMFARAAVNLGKLECNEIVRLYAAVLEYLCDGEIEQVEKKYCTNVDWDYYLRKNYKKTGSLIEASAKAPGALLGLDEETKKAIASYGENLGAAFQIVDDILDYTSDEATLGKPAGSDLKEGQVTAPVLYALEELGSNTELKNGIEALKICMLDEDAPVAEQLNALLEIIKSTKGIERSKELAQDYIKKAIDSLSVLKPSVYKQALEDLANYVLERNK